MKKILLNFFIILTFLSCSKEDNQENNASQEAIEAEKQDENLSVILITDISGINDKAFNQSAWEGLQRAKNELGIEVGYIETNQIAEQGANIEAAIDKNPDLIITIGYLFSDKVLETAKLNPDIKFLEIDNLYNTNLPDNLIAISFKAQQASYLVGYIAGKMTQTNKVGFIGGMKGNIIDQFHYGYLAGIKKANPDVEIVIQYADSYTDTAKGKAIANNMYLNNVDIIFTAAGAVGEGSIESAKENNKYFIGVDRDQYYLAPDNIISSAMKNVGQAAYDIVKRVIEKDDMHGNISFGLKDDLVGISDTSNIHVPQNILNEVKEIEEKIKIGEIEVPYNEETFNNMQ